MRKLHNSKRNMSSILRSIVFVAVCAIGVVHTASFAQAATLYLAPSAQSIAAGNIVSVKAVVSSGGVAINSANATINFPSDLLEVMSVSKSSSIFSLWVEEPSFSNNAGIVSFDGGLPNPGYVGQSGEVVSIVFKAKKAGTASIIVSEASVFANDGMGTDVLSSKGSAQIKIGSAGSEVPAASVKSNSLPLRPTIVSTTNPNQDAWYASNTATFSWNVPPDTTSVQTLLSKNKSATPTVTYDGSVSQRTVNNLTDGVWYFLVRNQNNVGWGPIASYTIQIDSTAPDKLTAVQNTAGNPVLSAHDGGSGVESYSVQVDGSPSSMVQAAALIDGAYRLPVQNPGKHTVSVVAYDKAGNHSETQISIVSPAIEAPTISLREKEVMRGDSIFVSGSTAYPSADIAVYAQDANGSIHRYDAKTDALGAYAVSTDPMTVSGQTRIWSQLVFSSSVQSPASDKMTAIVSDTAIVRTSKSILYGMSFIIPALAFIAALILMVYLGWHRFFGLRKKVRRESQSVINETHKAFNLFKDELHNQLDKLEAVKRDRDLNRKEEKIFASLKKNIEEIDDFIEKKLKKLM